MAVEVLKGASITVNGVDLSDYVTSIEISITREEIETTTFASGGGRSRIAGLEDSSISLTFLQDFGAASVDATINPLIGKATNVVIQTGGSTVSATKPSYTASVLVTEWMPIANAVGDAPEISVEWPVVGQVTKGTS